MISVYFNPIDFQSSKVDVATQHFQKVCTSVHTSLTNIYVDRTFLTAAGGTSCKAIANEPEFLLVCARLDRVKWQRVYPSIADNNQDRCNGSISLP